MSCAAGALRAPIVDSGVWAKTAYVPDLVYWVDGDRVLFLGATDEQVANRNVPPGDYVLKLFHVSKGSVESIESGVNGFCYADGNLLLIFDERGRTRYEPRSLGEAARDRRFEIDGPTFFDLLNCRVHPAGSAPGAEQGRRWKSLRGGDGVLDYGELPRTAGIPPVVSLQHRSADGSNATTLDLANNQARQIAYAPFRKEYLLYEMAGGRAIDEKMCVQPVHWFAPGNPVQHVDVPVPCDLIKGSGLSVFPTRAGYVIRFTGGAPTGRRSPIQGLHLAGGSKSGRLIEGFVGGVDVSPDGCKVAFVHADSIRAKQDFGSTLKVIDLCAGGGPS